MHEVKPKRRHDAKVRALIEISFIVFLFYSNLLMGEFNRSSGRHKTFVAAFTDIFTWSNLSIGLVSAVIGYLGFEHLRRRS